VRSLTCYRLKREVLGKPVEGPDDYIDFENRQVVSYGPAEGRNFEAMLFMSLAHRQEPPWADFIRAEFADVTIRQTSSTAAILIVRITIRQKGVFFAFPFGGGGRFLLRQGVWERGYGLRTALNLIYPRKAVFDEDARLVSVDTKRRGPNTVRARGQTSRATAFETFGVDRLRDVLNAATGPPVDSERWGRRISGADTLSMSGADIEFDEIGDLCHRVDGAHRRSDYRDRFGWLDHIQPVGDTELRDAECSRCFAQAQLMASIWAHPRLWTGSGSSRSGSISTHDKVSLALISAWPTTCGGQHGSPRSMTWM